MKQNTKKIVDLFIVTLLVFGILILADSFSRLSAQSNEDCLTCHEDKDLFMDKDGEKISLYVNAESYHKSVHSAAECVDCHEKYKAEDLPHTKTPQKVNCNKCHREAKIIETSVHRNSSCLDCHSKHDIKPSGELIAEKNNLCLSCHRGRNIREYESSIHSAKNIGCSGCHNTGHKVKKISKSETSSMCGKCHGQHKIMFSNSIHSVALKSGNRNAPSCIDCHGSHKIVSAKISVETEGCLRCHLDDSKFPGDTIGSANFVREYKTSIHASIEKNGLEAAGCVDCHGDHNIQNPENPKASTHLAKQIETCGKCHKNVVENFKKSKHGVELINKNDKAPTCTWCHGEHDIQSVLISSEFSKLKLTDKCLDCHKDYKIPHKNYKGEEELIQDYKASQHYEALTKGNLNAPTCYDCHGAHEMEKVDNPDSKINRKNIAKTCGQVNCHSKQLVQYTGSIHEIGITEENNEDSPTCNNCHGNHVISSKKRDVKLVQSQEVIQLCSHCHASVELVKRNELPTKVTETYMESFHGLATRGGYSEAANCESCHGYHDVRPSDDPLSSINKKNLPVTCGKCHPGAAETLFMSKIHLTDPRKDSPWVYWITWFYIVFITVLIGFMTVHNILDFRLKRRRRNHGK